MIPEQQLLDVLTCIGHVTNFTYHFYLLSFI